MLTSPEDGNLVGSGKKGNLVRKPQELKGKGQAELRLLPSGQGWGGAFELMEMFCV